MDYYSGNPGAPAGGSRPDASGGPQSHAAAQAQAEAAEPSHGEDRWSPPADALAMERLKDSCPDEWLPAIFVPTYLGPLERGDYLTALLMAHDTVGPTTGLDWCDLRQFALLEAEIEQLQRHRASLMALQRPEILRDLLKGCFRTDTTRPLDLGKLIGEYLARNPNTVELVDDLLDMQGLEPDVIDARAYERKREVLGDLDKRIAGKRMQQHRLRQGMDKRLARREAARDRAVRNEPGRGGSGSGGSGSGGSSSGGSGADAGHGPRPEPSASFDQGGACATGPGASAEDGPAGAGLDTATPAPANPGSAGVSEAGPSPAVGWPPSLQGATVTAAMGPAPTSLPLQHPDGRLVLPGEIWDESWQESGPTQGTGPGTGLSPEAARADAPSAGRGGEAGQGSSSQGSPHQASSGPASPGHGLAQSPTDRPVGPSGSQPSRPPHPHRPGEGG
ncbi:MAG: hypothetical protein O9972_30970 [Burkholderiales bacterium]|nr:hypothetical protein [Burkholderiales bacterium]